MRVITKDDYLDARNEDKYYRSIERWYLYKAVGELVTKINPETVLELGPYKLPICPDGDTMDKGDGLYPVFLHDASVTPWPVSCHYDLFIGLQVWEHLEGAQTQAFDEVRRISDQAILSFPYKWNCPKNPSHHGIDDGRIAEWTLNQLPVFTQVIPSTTGYRRIIYHFRF